MKLTLSWDYWLLTIAGGDYPADPLKGIDDISQIHLAYKEQNAK